jgi:hypothetical protein
MSRENTLKLLSELETSLAEDWAKVSRSVEENSGLMKVIGSIRSSLERAAKTRDLSKIFLAVCDCIDLIRKEIPFHDYSSGKVMHDPPLTEAEKSL